MQLYVLLKIYKFHYKKILEPVQILIPMCFYKNSLKQEYLLREVNLSITSMDFFNRNNNFKQYSIVNKIFLVLCWEPGHELNTRPNFTGIWKTETNTWSKVTTQYAKVKCSYCMKMRTYCKCNKKVSMCIECYGDHIWNVNKTY